MQRKRGELVPIGEVVSGLDDALVPAVWRASAALRAQPGATYLTARGLPGRPVTFGFVSWI